MSSAPLRQSPLHAQRGETIMAAGLAIVERPFWSMMNLRGDPADPAFASAVREATGVALPDANAFAEHDGRLIAWLGPDEFLFIAEAAEMATAFHGRLTGRAAALTEVGAGFTTLEIGGANALAFLARGCALDLHPRVFRPGQCVQTHFAKTVVLMLLRDASPRFEVIVRRSFAGYLWNWLKTSV